MNDNWVGVAILIYKLVMLLCIYKDASSHQRLLRIYKGASSHQALSTKEWSPQGGRNQRVVLVSPGEGGTKGWSPQGREEPKDGLPRGGRNQRVVSPGEGGGIKKHFNCQATSEIRNWDFWSTVT